MIKLSDHFKFSTLLRFTMPSIAMMIVSSIYGMVDGLFVSNCVGETEFTAVNFIMPFLMMLAGIGFMFGTGGSALVAKTMGEGDDERANRQFSLLLYTSIATALICSVGGILCLEPLAYLLGARGAMLEHCVTYGRIYLMALPAIFLQFEFQSFCVTAEKPKLSFYVTLAAGVTNVVLDALFMVVFGWGLVGAAVATAISQCIGGFLPLIYFALPNTSLLRLTRARFEITPLLQACSNGFSELLSNVSMSLVSMLYNTQLLNYAGEPGVAAYGVLMYVNFVFLAIFIGFSVGSAPLISYHYGAGNHEELQSLRKKCLLVIGVTAVAMFLAAQALGSPIATLFVGYNADLYDLTLRGFRLFSFSFLFAGFAIFGSSFFTALNNGAVSAIVSFLRTLVLQIAAILLLPLILDTDGIWLSVVIAEAGAAFINFAFLIALRKKYRY